MNCTNEEGLLTVSSVLEALSVHEPELFYEADEIDVSSGLYWWLADNYKEVGSFEYNALCALKYRPDVDENSIDDCGEMARHVYDFLNDEPV